MKPNPAESLGGRDTAQLKQSGKFTVWHAALHCAALRGSNEHGRREKSAALTLHNSKSDKLQSETAILAQALSQGAAAVRGTCLAVRLGQRLQSHDGPRLRVPHDGYLLSENHSVQPALDAALC